MRVGERSVRGLARKLSLGPDPRQIYPRLVSGLPAGGETRILQLAGWSFVVRFNKKDNFGQNKQIRVDFHEALPVCFHSTKNWLGTWNKKRPITFPSNYYKHYGGKFPYFEML